MITDDKTDAPETVRCADCRRVLVGVFGNTRIVTWMEHLTLDVPEGVSTVVAAGSYAFCSLRCLYEWAGSRPAVRPLNAAGGKGGGAR